MYQLWLYNNERKWWMQAFYSRIDHAISDVNYFSGANKFDIQEWKVIGVIVVAEGN